MAMHTVLVFFALYILSEKGQIGAAVHPLDLTNGTYNKREQSIANAIANVALNCFSGGSVLFLTERYSDAEITASAALKTFMRQQAWSVTVLNTQLELPLDEFKEKKPKESNVVVLLNHEGEWSGILKIFLRLRILGPLTTVLLVAPSSEPGPLLLEAWTTLTLLNVTTLTYSSREITYHTMFPYEIPPRVKKLSFSDNFFPQKVPKDFRGYPLRVFAEPAEPPYVMKTAGGRLDGIEVRIFEIIADYYNLGKEYINPNAEDRTRRTYFNGMAGGVFRVITQHEADILLAGLRGSVARNELSEILVHHTTDRVRWAYPIPTLHHSWNSMYRAFSLSIWALVGSLIFIISAVSTLIENYQLSSEHQTIKSRFLINLLFTWGYVMETPSTSSPRTLLQRAFLTVTFMYTINLACSYKSTLVTLLTTPQPAKGYETALEAIEDGLIAYLHHMITDSSPEFATMGQVLQPGRFEVTRNTTLNFEFVVNRTGIAYALEYPSKYMAFKHFSDARGKPLVEYMPKPLSTFSVSFFMAPGHPLEERFNRKSLQLLEGGIIDILRDLILREATFESKNARKNSVSEDPQEPTALTIKNLLVVFVVHMIALTICGVLFFAELGHHHWNSRRARLSRV